MTSDKDFAMKTLMKLYQQCQEDLSEVFSYGLINNDYFHWRLIVHGVEGTPYYGGFFPIQLDFPETFPYMPPKMFFKCPMWHPNIDSKTGEVCITILHPPGKDKLNPLEDPSVRWQPYHTIKTIILSLLIVLQEPVSRIDAPLNPEANHDYLKNRSEYDRKLKKCIEQSINYI